MRYARLCIHDQLNPHDIGQHTPESGPCPGGEFLPEDALVIEKVEGEWPEWAIEVLYNVRVFFPNAPAALLDALFDGEMS